ncbi:PhnD/SsuA/transferrin family substrate-binding protein [Legionella sp. km772]|uniref:PhnD/SsuA/transferrin family substrate-binding protein n=1 Tax=Legionella sp. km772 TaxID=2498111 RepID=UPI000F8DBB98|nr:PhnD/SsuA/transferrin family substrate-binding protein [Legionella sp. km772]RUR07613.1 hypothetical protein ELY15_11980 [Legionella sp. km772]
MFKLFKTLFLISVGLISINCRAEPINLGVIAHSHDPSLHKNLHAIEVNAIQNTLHEPVEVDFFYDYTEALNVLKKHPKKYSFFYAKVGIGSQLKELGNWTKLAQVFEKNPETNKFSATYSSYLITNKKSNISNLNDLTNKKIVFFNTDSISSYQAIKQTLTQKKIAVYWIKAKNVTQALSMVASGKADAMGIWDYSFTHDKNSDAFKVFYKINGLETPSLYVNTLNVNKADIKKIKMSLENGKNHLPSDFTYHLE